MVASPPENTTPLGFTLGARKGIEAGCDLIQAEREPVLLVAGIGKADRAVEVAATVDLNDAETGVLFVLGAETAV